MGARNITPAERLMKFIELLEEYPKKLRKEIIGYTNDSNKFLLGELEPDSSDIDKVRKTKRYYGLLLDIAEKFPGKFIKIATDAVVGANVGDGLSVSMIPDDDRLVALLSNQTFSRKFMPVDRDLQTIKKLVSLIESEGIKFKGQEFGDSEKYL